MIRQFLKRKELNLHFTIEANTVKEIYIFFSFFETTRIFNYKLTQRGQKLFRVFLFFFMQNAYFFGIFFFYEKKDRKHKTMQKNRKMQKNKKLTKHAYPSPSFKIGIVLDAWRVAPKFTDRSRVEAAEIQTGQWSSSGTR